MIKILLGIRLRSILYGYTAQARKRGKSGKGTYILFGFLYLYVFAVMAGMMGVSFASIVQPYHAQGLDWLYFAMAGLMSLGFSLIGSVFTTQNQLYAAKDNPLLLSMPIAPQYILISRIIPLFCFNLLFASMVMLPAMVVYGIFIGFSLTGVLLQLLGLFAVVLLSQALACLLGRLLHMLLSRLNKSVASLLYTVTFLVLYFWIYGKAGDFLNAIVTGGSRIAGILSSWVWPVYALGLGCTGSFLHALVMPAVSCAAFGLVYAMLSRSFLKAAASTGAGRRKTALDLSATKTASPVQAVVRKELGKFLGSPVYLTNMGMGLIMTLALTVAGIIFSGKLKAVLFQLPEMVELVPLLVCAALSFLISTMCISTPSVSLEGKNIWILKAMPIASESILQGKLLLHCVLTIPLCMVSGLVLAVCYGCSFAQVLLCSLIPGLLALLCGLVGLCAGLQWARLDYISEAYPCKQSISVLVTMFSMMGLPLLLGLLFIPLFGESLSVTMFLSFCAALLAAACFGFYRLLMGWGVRKWENL